MIDESPISDWPALKSIYQSSFLCSLGFFVVRFVLPIAAAGMGANALQVALIFSFLTLGSAIFSPIAGMIAKGGRRRESILFGSSIRGFAYIGMASAIWFISIEMLIVNSLIWGLGAGFYWVGSDAEISERVIRENRSEAFGRRSAYNARGSVIGAVIGFFILFTFDIQTMFLFYALMNILGGLIVINVRPPLVQKTIKPNHIDMQKLVGRSIGALILAAAIDAFALAFLSPFVELYILELFTQDIATLAIIYLPSGIASSILGEPIGKLADRMNKVVVVSAAALAVSVTTFLMVILPYIFTDPMYSLLIIAILFTIQGVAGTGAFVVMSSVLGTVYEGKAGEGFGMFEAAMGTARFSGPLIGGILWDTISPSAPFIFTAFVEFLLIPAYYFGMKRYQQVVEDKTMTILDDDSLI